GGGATFLAAGGAALFLATAPHRHSPIATGRTDRPVATVPHSAPVSLPRLSAAPPHASAAPSPAADPDSRLRRLLADIVANAYDDFADGIDDQFRAVLDRDTIEEMANE